MCVYQENFVYCNTKPSLFCTVCIEGLPVKALIEMPTHLAGHHPSYTSDSPVYGVEARLQTHATKHSYPLYGCLAFWCACGGRYINNTNKYMPLYTHSYLCVKYPIYRKVRFCTNIHKSFLYPKSKGKKNEEYI